MVQLTAALEIHSMITWTTLTQGRLLWTSVNKKQWRRMKSPQYGSRSSHRNGRVSYKVPFSPSTKTKSKEESFESVHCLPSIDDFDLSSF